MAKINKIKKLDDPRTSDASIIKVNTATIEQTLASFGITARVVEINYRPKDTEFCLEIALGTTLESITKLNKDIAMALASPSGDVEIEAPMPGRQLIAIRTPYIKQMYESNLKAYKLKQEYENNNPIIEGVTEKTQDTETEFPKTFRDYFAAIFYVIGGILEITSVFLRKLGNFIEGRER
jgi:DNA segregation ATPase FtsK/SpoIIIE-like protein